MKKKKDRTNKWRWIRSQSSFTLIELLVVVAIISILASIALPNFQHAQVKAKVTAALAEMRTLSTVIEAYHLDNNTYPLDGNDYPDLSDDYFDQRRIQSVLTTPTAYITEIPDDLFHKKETHQQTAVMIRHFQSRPPYPYVYFTKDSFRVNKGAPNEYYTFSLGPDLDFDNEGKRFDNFVIYDASNGVVSDGDIMRKGP